MARNRRSVQNTSTKHTAYMAVTPPVCMTKPPTNGAHAHVDVRPDVERVRRPSQFLDVRAAHRFGLQARNRPTPAPRPPARRRRPPRTSESMHTEHRHARQFHQHHGHDDRVPKPRVSHRRPASGFDASAARAYSVKYRDTPAMPRASPTRQHQRDVDAVGHARKRRHHGIGDRRHVQEVPQTKPPRRHAPPSPRAPAPARPCGACARPSAA